MLLVIETPDVLVDGVGFLNLPPRPCFLGGIVFELCRPNDVLRSILRSDSAECFSSYLRFPATATLRKLLRKAAMLSSRSDNPEFFSFGEVLIQDFRRSLRPWVGQRVALADVGQWNARFLSLSPKAEGLILPKASGARVPYIVGISEVSGRILDLRNSLDGNAGTVRSTPPWQPGFSGLDNTIEFIAMDVETAPVCGFVVPDAFPLRKLFGKQTLYSECRSLDVYEEVVTKDYSSVIVGQWRSQLVQR